MERFQTALAMKEPDRVPVAPSVLTRAIKKAGAKQYDYHTNPEVLANAQILHLMADTGADCLEIDSRVDMARAKELVGNRVTLKCNVNTTSFIEKSIPELLDECRQVTLAGKPGGGFILSAGCETPADASEEAINAIREAADLYGAY